MPQPELTADDVALIQLYAAGMRDNDVAEFLNRKTTYVRTRMTRVRKKTGSPNITSLVHWALTHHVLEPVPLWAPLGLTEKDVVRVELFAQGYTRGQVARRVGLGDKGIETWLYKMLRKVGAHSRAHLIAMHYSEACFVRADLVATQLRGSVWEEWYGNRM